MNIQDIVINRFNSIAPKYYEEVICKRREAYNHEVDMLVIDKLSQKRQFKLLDAGCGTGKRAMLYKEKFPQSIVYGCDISSEMIKKAKSYPLIHVEISDLVSLDYSDNNFDYVTCLFFVICYFENKNKRLQALKELFRVLKPGGSLMIDAINISHFGEGLDFRRCYKDYIRDKWGFLFNPRLRMGDKLYTTDFEGDKLNGFFHAFNKKELIKLFRKAGFMISEDYIIGYNSGEIKHNERQGQFLFVLQKPLS